VLRTLRRLERYSRQLPPGPRDGLPIVDADEPVTEPRDRLIRRLRIGIKAPPADNSKKNTQERKMIGDAYTLSLVFG
jgi:hypothetical protein